MSKEKKTSIINGVLSTMLVIEIIVLMCLVIMDIDMGIGFPHLKMFLRTAPTYEVEEYRGVEIYFPKKFPEEQRYIFYDVLDSLHDDVVEEYSLKKVSTSIIVIVQDTVVSKIFSGGKDCRGFVYGGTNQIFLSPLFSDPVWNDGDRAMTIVHEYVHVVQNKYPEYLKEYAEFIGWEGELGEGILANSMTFTDYGLTNRREDMAVNFQYPYLCGNSMHMLSEERVKMISTFWVGDRESYCKDFP